MDIEQLTKSQIVLLTLLVSFMTSIATGIVTVALMQQTPPAIVQSVSRVIKETVAQVAPTVRTMQPAAVAAPTETKTVIVSDSDLIATAVAKASQSVVRLYSSDATDPQFLGLGIIVDSTGMVVTDTATVGESADASIKRTNGSYVHVFVTKRDGANSLAYLTLASTSTDPSSFGIPATFPGKALALGDRAIAIEGSAVTRIQQGFVTALPTGADTGTVAIIETDLARSGILAGTPIINTEGAIIGLSTETSRAVAGNGFIPASVFTSPISRSIITETVAPPK